MLCLQQTREAGETFLGETRMASLRFAQDLEAAGAKLLGSAGRSAQGLQSSVRKELLDWRGLVLQTREAYGIALQERFQGIQKQALGAREALKLDTVEVTVLQSARAALQGAQGLVDQRLQETAKPSKPVASKTARKRKVTKKGQTPLRNYDELTAKDLVHKVQTLSAPQASAVLDYELARKKRATVIRAIEQRLAVAS